MNELNTEQQNRIDDLWNASQVEFEIELNEGAIKLRSKSGNSKEPKYLISFGSGELYLFTEKEFEGHHPKVNR